MREIALLRLAALLTVTAVHTSASLAAASDVVTRLNLISVERSSDTTFDYRFSVTFTAGTSPLSNSIGHVTSAVPGTVAIDGDVSIGNLAAGASRTPPDTITIRQDQSRGFDAAALIWNFVSVPAGPVVEVSVAVTDPGVAGGTVSYRWRSTDGNIVDVNAATTTWTLPPGRGLHFAYVLVSNNRGGFTERRVAVNTDGFGSPVVEPTPVAYAAPPAPVPKGSSRRSFISGGKFKVAVPEAPNFRNTNRTFRPDTLFFLQERDSGITVPATGAAAPLKTDMRGQMIVHNVPAGDYFYSIRCSVDGGLSYQSSCGSVGSGDGSGSYYSEYFPETVYLGKAVVGRVRLADDSICGMKNDFFGTEVTATAYLLDGAMKPKRGPIRLSADGDFVFQEMPGAAFVRINCQGADPVLMAVGTTINFGNLDLGRRTLADKRAPVVSNMKATLKVKGGQAVGLFLPPPTGFPSDAVPDAERFLSYRGIDSRLSACQYYKAIGAVRSCDAAGNFQGAINVADWKRTVKIGAHALPGGKEYSATFINQVDLNLTRNHHSISYGGTHTAAYVCNHLGPPNLDATQAEINTAIDNAVAGKNLVACVMMDHIATPGVNGGKPYTRFLIFGPSGELLPSINLDGRREKFVPGVCVACHGGDKYVGKFPESGAGGADIGAHFLPYDVGNFAFSDKPGLTRAAQEAAIHNLNLNVLKAGPTPAAGALIAGWYAGGTTLNTNYLPPSWVGRGFDDVYHKVFAKSCRTCHVNMPERFDFDQFDNADIYSSQSDQSCDASASTSQFRKWGMPNSLVTFNRFWKTKGTSDDLTALFAAFLHRYGTTLEDRSRPCTLIKLP